MTPGSSGSVLAGALAAFNARPAAAADGQFLAALYASTRPDLDSRTAAPALVRSIMGMQQRLQGADYRRRFPDAHTLMLEHAGAPAARVVAELGARQLRLVDIAVLPALRGRGIGGAVVRALQACAAAHKVPLCLSVHLHNPDARRLYLALGLRPLGADGLAEQMRWDPHESDQA
ncbi:GNAT family N-acetyltransferase [Massilia glaciei]|nr:GNAT family N-acetyltransferase [Massilia glaciei]